LINFRKGYLSEFDSLVANLHADASANQFEQAMANFGRLHITSELFDEPRCLDLVAALTLVVGVHGSKGSGDFVIVGGRNARAQAMILAALRQFRATDVGIVFVGEHSGHICNRAKDGGMQLEISHRPGGQARWKG
jgi:phage replication-related protein YjqB (UPF0714/DUF867 family)